MNYEQLFYQKRYEAKKEQEQCKIQEQNKIQEGGMKRKIENIAESDLLIEDIDSSSHILKKACIQELADHDGNQQIVHMDLDTSKI